MRASLLPLVLAPLAGGLYLAGRHRTAEPEPARVAAAVEREIRDADIAFYRARAARDPTGALDLLRVGSLHLQRARESGQEADLIAAEEAARRSLANREAHNAAAWNLLAAALLGQHRFVEAREAAERYLAAEPDQPSAQALVGAVLLELGDYPAADRIFRGLTLLRTDLGVAPRYARWLELRGRAGDARALLESLAQEAQRRSDIPREQTAWFDLRMGELALRFGRLGQARQRLQAGLALVPDDYRLLAARARLAFARRDWEDTIAFGDSSLVRKLDPAVLALVGDAWRAKGVPTRAEEYYRAMEVASLGPRGGFHRAWYLALLDHHRRVAEVLGAVPADLETRRDVYGYDLLAWALYQSGRFPESRG